MRTEYLSLDFPFYDINLGSNSLFGKRAQGTWWGCTEVRQGRGCSEDPPWKARKPGRVVFPYLHSSLVGGCSRGIDSQTLWLTLGTGQAHSRLKESPYPERFRLEIGSFGFSQKCPPRLQVISEGHWAVKGRALTASSIVYHSNIWNIVNTNKSYS